MTGSAGKMLSWTSASDFHRRARIPVSVLATVPLMLVLSGAGTSSIAGPWQWNPRLSVGAGYEADRILDPDLVRISVPGGLFIDLAPGVSLTNQFTPRAHVRLNGELFLERFINQAERSVLSGAMTGDLVGPAGGPGQWRITLGATYLGDSERETVTRYTLGVESGYSLLLSRWRLELLGGLQARSYPNLETPDENGALGTYNEGALNLRGSGSWQASQKWLLGGWVAWRSTEARDPLFDANSLTVQGAVTLRLASRTWATANGLVQGRQFGSRLPEEDRDSYWQLGAGMSHDLSRQLGVTVRYAFARYNLATGGHEDIQRVAVTASVRLGSHPRVSPPRQVPSTMALEGRSHPFRLYAPGAKRVAVVGDFNGWDPARHVLEPEGNGWWSLGIHLPAGSYLYAYQVDGEMVTPPEAEATVEDGFGGRNGLLRVTAEGP